MNKCYLRRKYVNFQMVDGEDIINHIHSFKLLLEELATVGIVYSEEDKVETHGSIQIILVNGEERTLENVYHVPGLTQNLISVRQMTKAGCKVTFSENDVVLHSANGFMTTLIQPNKEGLYLLGQIHPCIYSPHFNKLAYHAHIRPSTDCSHLWHHCLGHANMRKLSTMQQLNVVHGFPKLTLRTLDFCKSCQHG